MKAGAGNRPARAWPSCASAKASPPSRPSPRQASPRLGQGRACGHPGPLRERPPRGPVRLLFPARPLRRRRREALPRPRSLRLGDRHPRSRGRGDRRRRLLPAEPSRGGPVALQGTDHAEAARLFGGPRRREASLSDRARRRDARNSRSGRSRFSPSISSPMKPARPASKCAARAGPISARSRGTSPLPAAPGPISKSSSASPSGPSGSRTRVDPRGLRPRDGPAAAPRRGSRGPGPAGPRPGGRRSRRALHQRRQARAGGLLAPGRSGGPVSRGPGNPVFGAGGSLLGIVLLEDGGAELQGRALPRGAAGEA